MKLTLLLSLVLTITLPEYSKASDTLYYAGNIKDTRKISLKYIMRFTVDSLNNVTGYTLTDPKGPYETKTKITGQYDSISKKLSFEETKILRTRIDTTKESVCFVKATLKFKSNKYVETLDGNYIGFTPGITDICSKGEIKLINTDRIKRIENEKQQAGPKKE